MNNVSINRQIAEALGYTVKGVPSLEDAGRIAYYIVLDPKGEILRYDEPDVHLPIIGYDEADAWERGTLYYEHSVDAVLAELPEDCHLQILYEAEDLYWAEIWQDGMKRPGWCMDGATRADAAADALRVYAEWKQAQA